MPLDIKPKEGCRWDLVALGEVMLRLDPGEGRVTTTRTFQAWEGGGEYNVARALKRCFGLDTAIVTAFADNAVGRLVQDLIYQGGVDQAFVRWVPFDGVGRTVRNGLNFTERGFGVRAAAGCSDRGHTAVSQLKAGDIDWDEIFSRQGARWFHTGGIFCALSETTPEVAIEALQAARRHGVVTSYDLNYRPSLWKSIGGRKQAEAVNRRIAPLVDVMFGVEIEGDEPVTKLDGEGFKKVMVRVAAEFPFQMVATTLRTETTGTVNDWGAICFSDGEFFEATPRPGLEIYDRVGGGDSFASGLIYGLLEGRGPAWAVECGAAHGALAMTTPGDTSMATLEEVLQVMAGGAARIAR